MLSNTEQNAPKTTGADAKAVWAHSIVAAILWVETKKYISTEFHSWNWFDKKIRGRMLEASLRISLPLLARRSPRTITCGSRWAEEGPNDLEPREHARRKCVSVGDVVASFFHSCGLWRRRAGLQLWLSPVNSINSIVQTKEMTQWGCVSWLLSELSTVQERFSIFGT